MPLVKAAPHLWVWNDRWEIRSPDRGDTHGHGLGYPRGGSDSIGHHEAYQALADWLYELGVKYICGPVLSGAQMAHVVSLMSGGRILPVYLLKHGYSPVKHYSLMSMRAPYALIDDIVSTGEQMGLAADEALRLSGEQPLAVIADFWNKGALEHEPLAKFANKA